MTYSKLLKIIICLLFFIFSGIFGFKIGVFTTYVDAEYESQFLRLSIIQINDLLEKNKHKKVIDSIEIYIKQLESDPKHKSAASSLLEYHLKSTPTD